MLQRKSNKGFIYLYNNKIYKRNSFELPIHQRILKKHHTNKLCIFLQ